MATDAPKGAEIVIPANWTTALQRYVLCIGGPAGGSIVPWFDKQEAIVMSGHEGKYLPSPKGHFAVWEEPTTTSSTDKEPSP